MAIYLQKVLKTSPLRVTFTCYSAAFVFLAHFLIFSIYIAIQNRLAGKRSLPRWPGL